MRGEAGVPGGDAHGRGATERAGLIGLHEARIGRMEDSLLVHPSEIGRSDRRRVICTVCPMLAVAVTHPSQSSSNSGSSIDHDRVPLAPSLHCARPFFAGASDRSSSRSRHASPSHSWLAARSTAYGVRPVPAQPRAGDRIRTSASAASLSASPPAKTALVRDERRRPPALTEQNRRRTRALATHSIACAKFDAPERHHASTSWMSSKPPA